ncbi:MAG: Flagellar basal-body rod protein [Microvirga sp.]|jgi:flagellar basal body rod protein FlgG|nr:Flagellar basal-body rod protein [Microvirga sp.]
MSDLIMGIASVIQREINMVGGIAHNTANVNTTGFKAARSFARLSGTDEAGRGADWHQALGVGASIDTGNGALQKTGVPTDVAIAGNAWLVVDTPDGVRLTRNGHLLVDADGFLRNANGFKMLGKSGPIVMPAGEPAIGSDGSITVGGEKVATLALVAVADPASMTAEDSGLYRTAAALVPATDFVIHQGMLEKSNVDLGTDMVRLMETTRHIETMQRALSAYDNLLESGINKIGKE